MTKEKERFLKLKAAQIRLATLEAVYQIKKGHIGGSFSIAEILSDLYFSQMQVDSANPNDPERDRFVMSKGHSSPAGYAVLYLKGFITHDQLMTFRHIDSKLSGHMYMGVPGVDASTGSLGQGLSVATGMALSLKRFGNGNSVYCICGDGEIQEGQIWEAVMAGMNFHLDNLCVFVDNNRIQLDGRVEEISPCLEPIEPKFQAFGWNVISIDGNNVAAVDGAVDVFKQTTNGKPTCIVAHTIKGKGVSLFENQVKYHGGVPDEQGFAKAFSELKEQIACLEADHE
jgi:transketolase